MLPPFLTRSFCGEILLLFTLVATSGAEDWPQWRGANRDDLSRESGLLDTWPEEGPPQQWLYSDAGLGYGGPAIVAGEIFLMGARQETTYLLCLDADSGRQKWAVAIGNRYDNSWGGGPRGTPTVDGNFVYALSGVGNLVCVRRSNGDIEWQVSLEDLGGRLPTWGYSESVLVDDRSVYCTPGGDQGALVALDKRSGDLIWQTSEVTDKAHYSSPVPMNLGGQESLVQLLPESLVGIASRDGRLLWRVDWPGRVAVVPTPIVSDDRVYVTSGYGVGCQQVSVSVSSSGDATADEVFRNKLMKNHHGGVILREGRLFGYSDGAGWLCQSWETGEEIWRDRDAFGKGAVAYADSKFYCLEEDTGTVALIDAAAEGWQELGRFTLSPQTQQRKPKGKIWTHPVISQGRLYLRDQELFFCFDVKRHG